MSARIVVAGLVIVAAVHAVGAWHTLRAQRTTMFAEIDAHGRAIAEAIAAAAAEPLEHGDERRLQAIVLQIMAVADREAFVSVRDARGDVRLLHPPSQAVRLGARVPDGRPSMRIYRVPLVIGAEHIGEVAVGLSTRRAEGLTAERLQPFILVGALSLAATSGLLLVLLRHLLSVPLARLRAGAEAIAAGQLEQPVPMGRDDELGALAAAMEHMRLALRDTRRRVQRRTEELRESETRHVALNDELRAALDARTRAAEDAEAARVRAERLARANGAFLASIGHAIRTPLASMLGFLDLATGDRLRPEELAEFLASIRRNGQGLLEILGDALQLCAITSGTHPAQRQACAPERLVEEIADAIRTEGGERRVPIELGFDDALPSRIVADESRLREALLRILQHAVRRADGGPVRIVARPVATPSGPRLEVVIEHRGRPLDRALVAQVVEPALERMAAPRDPEAMHLLVARFLAETAGGSLELEHDAGTERFRLRMPVERADPAPSGADPHRAASEGVMPGGLVLVVEDLPDNRRVLGIMLRSEGCEVDFAVDGRDAIVRAERAAAASRPHDLVLMDMQMPVLDGYEATRRLRDAGYDRPIIALTAHAVLGDRERCLEAGCDDYATKPIDRAALANLVARWMPASVAERR